MIHRWAAIAVLAALLAGSGRGAEITADRNTVYIAGTIAPGDAGKLRALLTPEVARVVVSSGGGDIEEGIAIGAALNRARVDIVVDGYCMSACANYLFAAGRTRTVLPNSVVCYHGGAPRTDADRKALFLHIARNSHIDGLISDQEIADLVDDSRDIYGKAARDEADLLRDLKIGDSILVDSEIRMVRRRLIDASRMTVEKFMTVMRVAWCPSPATLHRYGIDTESMWYPATEDALFRLGRHFSRNVALVAHSARDLSDPAFDGTRGRYVATTAYQGLGDDLDLANVYNNVGVKAGLEGDIDHALADDTVAIRLKPDASWSYNNRGVAYASLGRYAEAIADYDAALRVAPDDAAAHANRGSAREAIGLHREAIADLDAALKVLPTNADALMDRGRAEFNLSRFPEAVADFRASLTVDPKRAYAVLWLHLAHERAGDGNDSDELARDAMALDSHDWPAPLVLFFEGRSTAAQAMTAAAQPPDEKTRRERGCEASFYLGEDALNHGDLAHGGTMMRAARDACPPNFIETPMAKVELDRIAALEKP